MIDFEKRYLIMLASAHFFVNRRYPSKQDILEHILESKWACLHSDLLDWYVSRPETKLSGRLSAIHSRLVEGGILQSWRNNWSLTVKGLCYLRDVTSTLNSLGHEYSLLTQHAIHDARGIIQNVSDWLKKTETRDSVQRLLQAFPFDRDGIDKVYVKILSDTEVGTERPAGGLQISLVNDRMLEYDSMMAEGSEFRDDAFFYRPYFYEFMTNELDDELYWALLERSGRWLVATFSSGHGSYIETDGIHIEGTVLFSASPIERAGASLLINGDAPKSINDRISAIYDTSGAVVDRLNTQRRNRLDKITTSLKQLKVYNVGQANLIELTGKNGNLLFDIGYTLSATDAPRLEKLGIPAVINALRPDQVILTHWDMDHILGICHADDMALFTKCWLAPDIQDESGKLVCLGAMRLARYVHWKNRLTLLSMTLRGGQVYENSISGYEIWMGQGKARKLNKANNSGLILVNRKKAVLLPGDCEYTMLPAPLTQETQRYKLLVVPHHCSEMAMPPPNAARGACAIISVGAGHHKHPVKNHLDYLSKRLGYQIEETRIHKSECINKLL